MTFWPLTISGVLALNGSGAPLGSAAPSPPPKKRRRDSDATLCQGNEGAATPPKARFKIGKKTESKKTAEAAEAAEKAAAEKAAAEEAAGKAKKHAGGHRRSPERLAAHRERGQDIVERQAKEKASEALQRAIGKFDNGNGAFR